MSRATCCHCAQRRVMGVGREQEPLDTPLIRAKVDTLPHQEHVDARRSEPREYDRDHPDLISSRARVAEAANHHGILRPRRR